MHDYEVEGAQLVHSFHKLWGILEKVSFDPTAGKVVCILDALDECAESGRFQIIDALNTLYTKTISSQHNTHFKFLVTSRPYLDIERRFKILIHSFPTIRPYGEKDTEAISEEINIVIEQRCLELGRELDLDKSEQTALELGLFSMTHRTYLWLKLIFEVIRNELSLTQQRLQRIIDTLPTTIEQAYEAILSKILDRERPRAHKLLSIVVAATRPLTLNELNIALAINTHNKSYQDLKVENAARSETTVRNICGLFISVLDQKVYLIHQTAKEFLVTADNLSASGWKNSINAVQSDLLMTKTCVTYLMFSDFDEYIDQNLTDQLVTELHVNSGNHDYLNYAAIFWATHYREAQKIADYQTRQLILALCDTRSARFKTWLSSYWNFAHEYPFPIPRFSKMTIASYFGHEITIKLLLEMGEIGVNHRDADDRTPLSWAAENGHDAVVRLLLGTGEVEVDQKNREGRTPLWLATSNGHVTIVKLLYETGRVDLFAVDRFHRTPLFIAASRGHVATVKFLLDKGIAAVDRADFQGETPLLSAAHNGHKRIVELLLETGEANINSRNCDYQTPLSLAAQYGHEAVNKLLLETEEADINSRDYCYQTPLFLATQYGHEAVVKLLLETGNVDVNWKAIWLSRSKKRSSDKG